MSRRRSQFQFRRSATLSGGAALCLLWLVGSLFAQQPMSGVGITEKLGDTLPGDLELVDEAGQTIRLDSFYGKGLPIVLTLVYFECPGMCRAELNGKIQVMNAIPQTAGKDYLALTISFDSRETFELAARKKANYLTEYTRPGAAEGWRFLTGPEASIQKLCSTTGFEYRWFEDTRAFAHDSALILLTPEGRISRYLRGVVFDPATLRLALVEASGGKIGKISDRIFYQLCGYDPRAGKYVLLAGRVMSLGGALTLCLVAGGLAAFWWHEKSRNKKADLSDGQAKLA